MLAKNVQDLLSICNDQSMTEDDRIFEVRLQATMLASRILNNHYAYNVTLKTTDNIYLKAEFISYSTDKGRRRADQLIISTANNFSNILLIGGEYTKRYDDEPIMVSADDDNDALAVAISDLTDGSIIAEHLICMLVGIYGHCELADIYDCIDNKYIHVISMDEESKQKELTLAKQLGLEVINVK